MQLCTTMWQALPAALLPWPGLPCGSWWQAASQRRGGKQRLYRHLVNLWELLRSYQTKRGLASDKEPIQTPVSRRERGREREAEGEQRRSHNVCTKIMEATRMHFYKWPIDVITSEGHTQSRDVWQPCNHSTSATGLRGGGGVNKMRQRHRYAPRQWMCPAFRGN